MYVCMYMNVTDICQTSDLHMIYYIFIKLVLRLLDNCCRDKAVGEETIESSDWGSIYFVFMNN